MNCGVINNDVIHGNDIIVYITTLFIVKKAEYNHLVLSSGSENGVPWISRPDQHVRWYLVCLQRGSVASICEELESDGKKLKFREDVGG